LLPDGMYIGRDGHIPEPVWDRFSLKLFSRAGPWDGTRLFSSVCFCFSWRSGFLPLYDLHWAFIGVFVSELLTTPVLYGTGCRFQHGSHDSQFGLPVTPFRMVLPWYGLYVYFALVWCVVSWGVQGVSLIAFTSLSCDSYTTLLFAFA
jgi:hypothetical protein